MRYILPILIAILPCSCKTIQISNELDDQATFHLYRQTLKGINDLSLLYNADSSFVVCLELQSEEQPSPVSFAVVDIAGKKKVLVSHKTYLGAAWIDKYILRLEKRSGLNLESKDPSKPVKQERYEYYNVMEKKFTLTGNSI